MSVSINDDGNLSFKVKILHNGNKRILVLQFFAGEGYGEKIEILEKIKDLLSDGVNNLTTLVTTLAHDFPGDETILNLLKDFSKKDIIPGYHGINWSASKGHTLNVQLSI
ncbi:MAG: hypothetical protein ACKKMR_03595 [Candidatus Nealsonbacteria bacterium]